MRIEQPKDGYRFSADSLLLAEFVTLLPGEKVLDLGTGVGTILLLLAQRYPDNHFVGVEIQEELAAYAQKNVESNGWQDRIEIIKGNYRDLSWPGFTVVVSNPPYFPLGTGRSSPNPSRQRARSEVDATLEQTLTSASRALLPGGRFYLVHLAQRLDEIEDGLGRAGLAVVEVQKAGTRSAPRVLVGACKVERNDYHG